MAVTCVAVQLTATAKNANVGYKFYYRLENGMAIITGIDPKPVGTVVIPDQIDGHTVTGMEGYNDESPFWGCDQLTRVVLPAGLELGPAGAFFSCKSLSSIEISSSNKKFATRDGALYSKDFSTLFVYPKTRESVNLSPKTRKVGGSAFRGCALKTAKIPEGIEVIEPWNLCACPNLEWIEFPKSLKYLGQCAAHGNDKLKKIVFNGDAPQVGLGQFSWGKQYVFTGAPEDLVVEVRKGTKGWMEPDSTELPEFWPENQEESRPVRLLNNGLGALPDLISRAAGADDEDAFGGTHGSPHQRRMMLLEEQRQMAVERQRRAEEAAEKARVKREQLRKELLQLQEKLRRQREANEAKRKR